ncbi:CGGC domain-containing protein [Robinsoniella peoriensis]|uniref:CGGC domain-containing protein n=1 Tax=Robinsoniella peoriensis TaxID=180332 RepID=UPI00363BDFE7
MLNCLKANEICTGAACMKAFYTRSKSFSRYAKEEAEVAVFMRCNGCENDPATDKGMQEKLQRLVEEGIQTVHAGVCTKDRDGKECPVISRILDMIAESGIEVVRGTH